jgi:hypothetical protein
VLQTHDDDVPHDAFATSARFRSLAEDAGELLRRARMVDPDGTARELEATIAKWKRRGALEHVT